MSYHELSGFQRDLLQASAALTQRDETPYGLALKAALDADYDEPIHHSRLYQNLDELVAAGYLAREPVDDRTNRYVLTQQGRDALTAQARQLAHVTDAVATDGGDEP